MELNWEEDVEIPGALDKWKTAAKEAQVGASIGGLEKKEADRLAHCLRLEGKGARTVSDPKSEGKYRVWCVEKLKRKPGKRKTSPQAGSGKGNGK